jgi:hypothetical protein
MKQLYNKQTSTLNIKWNILKSSYYQKYLIQINENNCQYIMLPKIRYISIQYMAKLKTKIHPILLCCCFFYLSSVNRQSLKDHTVQQLQLEVSKAERTFLFKIKICLLCNILSKW